MEPHYRLEGIVRTRSEEMEDFEGPLDVIFTLLSKNKIEIQDVSITAILEQYLAYLDEMKRLDMEIASEFITMASHLMLIKTKMLLSAAEQAEAESELDLLRQSLIERKRKEMPSRVASVYDLSYRDAFLIGCFQALSLIPGTSRSGSTILGGMLLGVSRTAAAEFSFFMAAPVMAGASLIRGLKFISSGAGMTGREALVLAIGALVAFVVSLVAIRFLMGFVKRHSFEAFGWYRIILGSLVLVFAISTGRLAA